MRFSNLKILLLIFLLFKKIELKDLDDTSRLFFDSIRY